MKSKLFLVLTFLLACFLAFGVTIPKLYKMCQIKQWVPGGIVTKEVITQKWHQTANEHYKGRNVYWLSWTSKDIHEVGDHRVNLEKIEWEKKNIGDEIELIFIKGEKTAYLRDGIFVSVSNFLFDIMILVLELSYIIYILISLRLILKLRREISSN